MARRSAQEPRSESKPSSGDPAAVYYPPGELVPWDVNPRRNDASVASVARSIESFGFGSPIVARLEDRRVISGHTRLKAALQLGLELVPVRFLDVSEEVADRLAIADNRIGETADWDADRLSVLLKEIRADGFDLSTLGFSGNELARLIAPPTLPPTLDPSAARATKGEQGKKQADVLEGHARWNLTKGDGLEMLRALPDGSIDGVLTDPPYSSGGQFRSDRVKDTGSKYVGHGVKMQRQDFSGDNRDQRSMLAWCSMWITEAVRILKPWAVIGIFTDWRQLPLLSDALQAGGVVWRGIVVWDKVIARPVLGRPTNQCEYVLWGSKGSMPLRPELGVIPGVVTATRNAAAKLHQTGKPIKVMRTLARVIPADGVIVDPFSGSGSTGVGALLEGRRFIGRELGDEYFEIATRRLREYRVEDGDDAVALGIDALSTDVGEDEGEDDS